MSGARLKSQVVVPARAENLHNDDGEEGEITSPHSDHTPPGSRSQSRSRSGSRSRSASPAVVGDLDYAIQLQQYTRHREQQERRQEQRRERRQDNQRRSQERRRDRSRERRREDRHRRDRHHDGGRRRSSSPKQSADKSSRTSDQPREAGGAVQREPRAAAAASASADPSLTTRTGGAYIPPARLRLMQQQITDKSSVAYQRLAWEALKKSLNGLVNKVNVANLVQLVPELLAENVVRGRGLLCRAVLQAQAASPTFTHVYAALIAIVNSKFPQIGELLLHRLVLQFKRGFRRNDKPLCMSACRFIAHLVNFQVAHEVLALEVLTLLLESPTDDSVEVAVSFLEQAGHKLAELSPRGVAAIFEQLRHILHQAHVDTRVQYMIEVAFAVRKDGFKSFPSMLPELDQVDEDDQFTHMVALDDTITNQEMLNVFRHDPDYEDNEQKYATIRQELLGDDSASDNDGGGGGGSDDDDQSDSRHSEADDDDDDDETAAIVDSTEQVLRSLRQTIYLAIQSSLDFEETAHKLLRLQLKPGQEVELCHMIIDCCAQERSYLKFFGLLAERFCNYNRKYQEHFETIFAATYDTVHRLETVKLRNVAKLYSHLLHSDAISWAVLQHVRLNEQDTTSSSRIFVKICFQELCEFMGLVQLCRRVADPTLSIALEGLFPRDNPINTRFAINFFTSIGLGGLTEGLRDHLKSQPKPTAVVAPMTADRCPQPPSAPSAPSHSDSSSTSSASSSSDSSSSDSSSSDSSSSSSSSGGGGDRKSKKKSRRKRQSRAKHASKKAPAKSKKRSVRSERDVSSRKKSRRA